MIGSGFKLGRSALREVAEIITFLHSEVSASVADKMERRFFSIFTDLAIGRAVGHKRSDLTPKKVLFYTAHSYTTIFRKASRTTYILHVIHVSRDIRKLI